MDEAEGVGGDSVDQFHRNEAISAVTDDAYVEEDDDDYEDLYNDVNVGEGFFQSMRKNEDSGFRNQEQASPPRDVSDIGGGGSSIPGVGRVEGEVKFEGDGYQSQGFRGSDVGIKGVVQLNNGSLNSGPGSGPLSSAGRGYGGLRVELGQQSNRVGEVEEKAVTNSIEGQGMGGQPQQPHGMNVGNVGNEAMVRPVGGGGGMNGNEGRIVPTGGAAVQAPLMVAGVTSSSGGGPVGGGGFGGGGGSGTLLFVGDLHWWTTDAEIEAELVKYGPVKEVKFFDEKASGKSKGYCQVEFYDSGAASACKEAMNGFLFNGRPCVVAFASPHTIKRMGEAQVNKTQQLTPQPQWQGGRGRGANDFNNSRPAGNNISTGGNYQGGDQNRNFVRGGNWGRGNPQGMGGRGPIGPIRNRPGGMGGRGIIGNGGNGFGQGMGPTPLMPPQAMMGQGFDPGFGGPMGRMGNFGGFGGPTPPFQGMMSSFPPVGNVGLPGVAPHVNPAFFGRGMPMNGMGMMPNAGMDGPNMGMMWSDPNMGGWAGDEHGGRAAESSYGEEALSDHQYGEASHERGGWQNPMKEKERGTERDFSGSSDRRYRDDREPGYERDMPREKDAIPDQDWSERKHREVRDDKDVRDRERSRDRERDRGRERSRDHDRERDRDRDHYREDRDKYSDHHRYKDREPDYDDEWDRGRSSRTHSKSRVPQEENRSRSRDADYEKRRRITSE